MIYDLDLALVDRVADSTDPQIYNSAAQALAVEIDGLRARRSWLEDDAQIDMIDRMIRDTYDQMIRLLANLAK